jgi:hypothetical protein
VHTGVAESLSDVGVAILVRVTEREHAADLATNVQYADDDVAILADD